MNSIYENGDYLFKNPGWHEHDSPWKAGLIKKMLERNNLHPSEICEVGCGAGGILSCLASESAENVKFFGYDISPQAYEISKHKEKDNIRFHLKDLLHENEARFDLVMCIDVFEHVEDYLGFLKKLKGKGEYKIFHIPLDLSVQTVLRGSSLLERRSSLGHIHYFTKQTALATLTDTGYKIVDYCYTHKFVDAPALGWKNKVTKKILQLCFLMHEDLAARILGCSSLLVLTK